MDELFRKQTQKIRRREFLESSMALLGAGSQLAVSANPLALQAQDPGRGEAVAIGRSGMRFRLESGQGVCILVRPGAGFQERLASKELARGLRNLGLVREPVQSSAQGIEPAAGDLVFSLKVSRDSFKHPEAYEIAREESKGKGPRIRMAGATPQAVLYAVFEFLERQGAFFGLGGESYPLQPARDLNFPLPGNPWQAHPRFQTRGFVPWPDFLNCITVYNREDFRAYLEAMVRMRINTLGIHVYSSAIQYESFLSFEYGSVGHFAYTDTTATNRTGYLPERTSQFGMGAANLFDGEVFGSEATTKARNCWEAQEFAQALWGEAFRYAKDLGVRTGVGFEPYQVPDEIFRAAPPEARVDPPNPKIPTLRINPESAAARDILEARLGRLLEVYPTVDHIWLWEDEAMCGASEEGNVSLSVTPFKQAYDFLRRHAPDKRLVVSGWGGVARHFASLHRSLPEDVIFASLSSSVGWEPVSEEFAKLEGRERWPIPWLEDDPSMWFPQFHVHRLSRDIDLAEKYGCQGVLGIHWRQRIMDADAGFLSRYSWNRSLQPSQYFRAFAAVHARPARVQSLSEILERTDRDRLILDSFVGVSKTGRIEVHEYTPDYGEGFYFWVGYDPPQAIMDSQVEVARELRALAASASGAAEQEQLNYLTGHIEFLTPYCKCWLLASHLNQVLQEAKALKAKGNSSQAREKVLSVGVPLWMKLAPQVREVLLTYQGIVSERDELGALASMHNKFERLALFRLRLSMKEFLGLLPPEVERLFEEVREPDLNSPPRVFVPTRPTLLKQHEQVRLFAVAPGGMSVESAMIHVRASKTSQWKAVPMNLVGRRTFEILLRPPEASSMFLDYFVRAEFETGTGPRFSATAPAEAPARFYTITLA